MDFFINIGIIGIALIILGKSALRANKCIQQSNNFKSLDNLIHYMESELLAKINLKYGKQMLITGILGALFYNSLGLLMVIIMLLVIISYLASIFISGYKFYLSTR